jgi:hypothetical protein
MTVEHFMAMLVVPATEAEKWLIRRGLIYRQRPS